jgi:hypothetical protein
MPYQPASYWEMLRPQMGKKLDFNVDVLNSLNLKPRVQEALYRILMHTESYPSVWTTGGGKFDEHDLTVEFHDTQDSYLARKSVGGGTDSTANADPKDAEKQDGKDDFNFLKGALGTPIDQYNKARPGTASSMWVQSGCIPTENNDWTVKSAKEWCRAHPEVMGFTFYAEDHGLLQMSANRVITPFFKPRGSVFYNTELLWETGHNPSSKDEHDGYGTYVKDEWQSLLFMAGLKEDEALQRRALQTQRHEAEWRLTDQNRGNHVSTELKDTTMENDAKRCAFEEKAETMQALFMQIIHKDLHFDENLSKLNVSLRMLLHRQ